MNRHSVLMLKTMKNTVIRQNPVDRCKWVELIELTLDLNGMPPDSVCV